jgi:hypothetical protein
MAGSTWDLIDDIPENQDEDPTFFYPHSIGGLHDRHNHPRAYAKGLSDYYS